MTERAHDPEPDNRLIEVAAAVADRTPVDWEQEQGQIGRASCRERV